MKVARTLPLSEITLRKYEKVQGQSRRDSIKYACLSLGLLQPGDSRDVIIDVLEVLFESKKTGEYLTSEEIKDRVVKMRIEKKVEDLGASSSNIRRQLKRLKDLFIIEKQLNGYRLSEFSSFESLYLEKIEKFVLEPIRQRVIETLRHLDNEYR